MTPAKLPESVAEIAEVIGREQALHLIGSLPQAGRRRWRVCLYVPATLRPSHPLVKTLGWHDAMKMVRAFGGMILQPSNCRFIAKRARDQRIRELADAGLSTREIAAQFDISADWVREILRGKRQRR